MRAAQEGWFDLSHSESPEFIGRMLAALFHDPALMEWSGKVVVAAEVALELGVRDIDGPQPIPRTLRKGIASPQRARRRPRFRKVTILPRSVLRAVP
jgi:hypothetical protein